MFTSLAAVCCSLCHLANSFRINQRPPPADTLVLSAHIPFCRALQGVVGTRTPFGLRSRANLRFRNACGRGVLCAQWVSKCAVQCTDELTLQNEVGLLVVALCLLIHTRKRSRDILSFPRLHEPHLFDASFADCSTDCLRQYIFALQRLVLLFWHGLTFVVFGCRAPEWCAVPSGSRPRKAALDVRYAPPWCFMGAMRDGQVKSTDAQYLTSLLVTTFGNSF